MRKCTNKPDSNIECEELEMDTEILEACYCETDNCNKDHACTCGTKCQICSGQDGACENEEDNGVTGYCLKGQSCAYFHMSKKLNFWQS